jgi:hypothetical protein
MRSSRSIGTCQYWASDRPRGGPSRPSPQSRIGGVGMIARSIKGAARIASRRPVQASSLHRVRFLSALR